MENNRSVAIIVPIYNVQKYLDECLSSCVNQTYRNLQIILVNDGSSDASFDICKKYFLEDKRITIINQTNQGQSSARNSGLDYLNDKLFDFANTIIKDDYYVIQARQPEQKVPFSNFSYGGGAIEVLSHSKEPESVDFIAFLDSDDFLDLSFVQKCLDNALAFDAQIVWVNQKCFYEDDILQIEEIDILKRIGSSQEAIDSKIFRGIDIFNGLSCDSFSTSCYLLISFDFVRNMRFAPYIQSEDALFGMLLFAQAQRIKVLSDKMYFYRVRAGSISEHGGSLKKKSYPDYMIDISRAFDTGYEVKHYHFAFSCAIISLGVLDYINANNQTISSELKDRLESFIRVRTIYAFGGLGFSSDPMKIREIIKPLCKYWQLVDWKVRLMYYAPSIFKILKTCKRTLSRQK